ncbi:MAG: hypothetical protein QOD07_3203, partial [Frankiaceae bacterium]|nr:hypothetical protein [Frankiaceae bacterium]
MSVLVRSVNIKTFGCARLRSVDADRLPTGPGTGDTDSSGPAERFKESVPAVTPAGTDSVASRDRRRGSRVESACEPSPARTS